MNRRLISVLFFALVVAGGTSYFLYRLIVVRVQSQGHTVAANKLVVAKHDLQVVGYWVPEGATAWDNTFVYLVAHSSREEAKKNWDAMLADPEVQEAIKSEQANKLVEKIDRTYMRSTDFSPMK